MGVQCTDSAIQRPGRFSSVCFGVRWFVVVLMQGEGWLFVSQEEG